VFGGELGLDRREVPVGSFRQPGERVDPSPPVRAGGRPVLGRQAVSPKLPVRVPPRDRVVVDRRAVALDDAGAAVSRVAGPASRRGRVERVVLGGRERLDRLRDVPVRADLSRKHHEVDLSKEVRRQPSLDGAVDERLHVGGVGRSDDPVTGVDRLGERLEAGGRVDLGDHLDIRVEVVGVGHQRRHAHRLVRVLVVAGGQRHAGLVREPHLAGALVDGDRPVVEGNKRHVGVHQRRFSHSRRTGKEDDPVVFVQQPQQGDERRRQRPLLDQIDRRHRVRRLFPDRDVRAVRGDDRQRHRTPDGLRHVREVEVHLRGGRRGVQFHAVAGRQPGDHVDEPGFVVEREVRRDPTAAGERVDAAVTRRRLVRIAAPSHHGRAGNDLHALADAVGLDVLQVRIPDRDGQRPLADEVAEHVVDQVVEAAVRARGRDRRRDQPSVDEEASHPAHRVVEPAARGVSGEPSREVSTGVVGDERRPVVDGPVDGRLPDPAFTLADELRVARQQVRLENGVLHAERVGPEQPLAVDDDVDGEAGELDRIPREPLAGDALDVVGAGVDPRLQRRERVRVDHELAVVADVGHFDPAVERDRRELAEQPKLTQRVVADPATGGRGRGEQPVEHPLVLRLEARLRPLDSAGAGERTAAAALCEVVANRLQRALVGRRERRLADPVAEPAAVALADRRDDARRGLVLRANVGGVPCLGVVWRDRGRHGRRLVAVAADPQGGCGGHGCVLVRSPLRRYRI
jgi:hypothetical protein